MDDPNTLKKVEMHLREDTIKYISAIATFLECRTKADAVAIAVHLTKLVINTEIKGGRVIFEDRAGRQERLFFDYR